MATELIQIQCNEEKIIINKTKQKKPTTILFSNILRGFSSSNSCKVMKMSALKRAQNHAIRLHIQQEGTHWRVNLVHSNICSTEHYFIYTHITCAFFFVGSIQLRWVSVCVLFNRWCSLCLLFFIFFFIFFFFIIRTGY